jgi:hypothetical protein
MGQSKKITELDPADVSNLMGTLISTAVRHPADFSELLITMVDSIVESCDTEFSQYDLMLVMADCLQCRLAFDDHIAVAAMLGPVIEAMNALPVERHWGRHASPALISA